MSTQQQSLSAKAGQPSSIFTTGLALFSMFFGAGNLIFPLLIGKSVGENVWFAILGLSLTAVIVPFLGLGAMVLFQGDYRRFFGRIGKIPGLGLLLLLQLILGPLGVIPRLVTLMHAMAKPYLNMPLIVFSILITGIIFVGSFRRHWFIGLLGKILTPVLLLSLTALVFFSLTDGSSFQAVGTSPNSCFLQGLLGGYNTMDLIAAFLFATVILPHFHKETALEHPQQRHRSLLRKIFFSSLIAASLLLLTYIGLCLVSAKHGWTLDAACPAEQMLSAIAIKLLGPVGGFIAAVAVITACLTTAMVLVPIFADYLSKDLCKDKLSSQASLIITLVATTLVASMGFGNIAAFLGPILQIVYPGLILLSLLNLLHSLYGYQMVKLPVFFALVASAIIYFR